MGDGDLELSFTTYLHGTPDDHNDDIARAGEGFRE
jgi:hypothetical protein